MSDMEKSDIATTVSLAKKFLESSSRTPPASFIKRALQQKLITKGGIAKVLGVNQDQVMRIVTRSGNRDMTPVAQVIISAGQQRLCA